jgi:hypothetical protein
VKALQSLSLALQRPATPFLPFHFPTTPVGWLVGVSEISILVSRLIGLLVSTIFSKTAPEKNPNSHIFFFFFYNYTRDIVPCGFVQ